MERVIVTGANGFIGRNFIKYLAENDTEVYAVDMSHEKSILRELSHVHLVECSLAEIMALEDKINQKGFDAFYHFAWAGTTGKDRSDYMLQTDNARYACDAAIVSKKLGCQKFIATGTITEKVAERILDNHYASENLIYGLSKLYAHKLLDIVCRKNSIDYVWAQLSNIFGGDNTNGNLVSYTLKEFEEGRVPSYGPCEQPYNFTYIRDVLKALYLLGECKTSDHQYLISNGECMKLKDYLNELGSIYNQQISIGKREDDGVRYEEEWFDNTALIRVGFKPKYTFVRGIEEIRGEGQSDTEI